MRYWSVHARRTGLAAHRPRGAAGKGGFGTMSPARTGRTPSPTVFLSKVILGAIAVVMAGVVAVAGPVWAGGMVTMAAVATALVVVTTRWGLTRSTPEHGPDRGREQQRWTSIRATDGRSAVDEGHTRHADVAARALWRTPIDTGAARPTRSTRSMPSTRARCSAIARPVPYTVERRDASTPPARRGMPGRLAGRLRLEATVVVLAVLLAVGALLLGLGPVAAAVAIGATSIAVAVGGAVLLVARLTRPDSGAAKRLGPMNDR